MHIDLDSAVNNRYASLSVPINIVHLTKLNRLLLNCFAKFTVEELDADIVIQEKPEPLRIDRTIWIKYADEDFVDAG